MLHTTTSPHSSASALVSHWLRLALAIGLVTLMTTRSTEAANPVVTYPPENKAHLQELIAHFCSDAAAPGKWGCLNDDWRTIKVDKQDGTTITLTPNFVKYWDVSRVTDFSNLFTTPQTKRFDNNLSGWDVSRGVKFDYMLSDSLANSPHGPSIQNWDMSNARSIQGMFYNHPLMNTVLNWDVSKVTDMSLLFQKNLKYNSPLGCWNVSNVRNMGAMFREAPEYNQNLNQWDVSRVTSFSYIFYGATKMQPSDHDQKLVAVQKTCRWDTSSGGPPYQNAFPHCCASQVPRRHPGPTFGKLNDRCTFDTHFFKEDGFAEPAVANCLEYPKDGLTCTECKCGYTLVGDHTCNQICHVGGCSTCVDGNKNKCAPDGCQDGYENVQGQCRTCNVNGCEKCVGSTNINIYNANQCEQCVAGTGITLNNGACQCDTNYQLNEANTDSFECLPTCPLHTTNATCIDNGCKWYTGLFDNPVCKTPPPDCVGACYEDIAHEPRCAQLNHCNTSTCAGDELTLAVSTFKQQCESQSQAYCPDISSSTTCDSNSKCLWNTDLGKCELKLPPCISTCLTQAHATTCLRANVCDVSGCSANDMNDQVEGFFNDTCNDEDGVYCLAISTEAACSESNGYCLWSSKEGKCKPSPPTCIADCIPSNASAPVDCGAVNQCDVSDCENNVNYYHARPTLIDLCQKADEAYCPSRFSSSACQADGGCFWKDNSGAGTCERTPPSCLQDCITKPALYSDIEGSTCAYLHTCDLSQCDAQTLGAQVYPHFQHACEAQNKSYCYNRGIGNCASAPGCVWNSEDNKCEQEGVFLNCTLEDTKFEINRPSNYYGGEVKMDYGNATMDGKFARIPLEDVSIHQMDLDQTEIQCISYFMDPSALPNDYRSPQRVLNDTAYELMRGDVAGLNLNMTHEANPNPRTTCARYWDAWVPLANFSGKQPFNASVTQVLSETPLNATKSYYASYLTCFTKGTNTLAHEYRRSDFVLIMELPYDFTDATSLEIGSIESGITVRADPLPNATNTDRTIVDHSQLYDITLNITETYPYNDSLLESGEVIQLWWQINTTLDYLRYDRLDKLHVDWKYTIVLPDGTLEKVDGAGWTYYERTDPNNQDPMPLCLSTVVYDPSRPSKKSVYPTDNRYENLWFLEIMFPLAMYDDSETQRSQIGGLGHGRIEVTITLEGTLSLMNPDWAPSNISTADGLRRRRDAAVSTVDEDIFNSVNQATVSQSNSFVVDTLPLQAADPHGGKVHDHTHVIAHSGGVSFHRKSSDVFLAALGFLAAGTCGLAL